MPDIIGIDHIYITVSDLIRSEQYYDILMPILGFRKKHFLLGNEPHIQYYNRHFGYVLRPATTITPHNPYAPGLHHFCLRVESKKELDEIATLLKEMNLSLTGPKLYADYAPDYHAIFITDPDGIQLEITNYRDERKRRHDDWDKPVQ